MRKYNKGEWSEIYVFCYLLVLERLYAADSNLNRKEDSYFPIISIIREETEGYRLSYHPDEIIRICNGDTVLKEINKSEFRNAVDELLTEIPKGTRAFEIPSVDSFLDSICCNKVKEKSNKKQDITIQLQDIYTGIRQTCGFSIKSYLGANPTLINPGENTNFVFTLKNCNDEIMEQVNSINTRNKLIDRMRYLLDCRCEFEIEEHLLSSQLEENLQFIDTVMPKFMSIMVLYAYQYGLKNTADVIQKMKEMNPLNFSNVEMYVYKYKKLLCAFALGLTPERTDWMGSEDANGGYITVKKDGTVVCYHLYNRTEFEQYLYDYTYFDKPSTGKYKYFKVYKSGNEYKIKLCLQVRFR